MITAAILLLSVAAQADDLGREFSSPDHQFAFRPPAGWTARSGTGPAVAKFVPPERPEESSLSVIHYSVKNATPMAQFRKELEAYLAATYKDHTPLLTRPGTIDGLPSLQLALRWKDTSGKETVVYRAILHRTHLDYYLFDGHAPASATEKTIALFEKSVGTFRLRPSDPTVEEKAAAARVVGVLREGVLGARHLEGESWQGVFLEKAKVGYQRQKFVPATLEGRPGWLLESDTFVDFREGGKDRTVVRGSFTSDGRVQKIDSEETIVTEKGEELKYRYSAVVRGDRVTVRRHMRGVEEESSFQVPEGTLVTDVADAFRRSVALRPKQTWHVPVLNPFEDRTGWEWVEAAGKETVSVKTNESKDVYVVLSTVGRRRILHYWYELSGTLYVLKGPKQVFVVFGMSKEDAMKSK